MFTPETAHSDYPVLDLEDSTVLDAVDSAIRNQCANGDIDDIAEDMASELADGIRSALWDLHHPDYTPDVGDDMVAIDPDEDPLDVLRSTLSDFNPDDLRDAYTPPVYDHDLTTVYEENATDVDEYAANYGDLNGIVVAYGLDGIIPRVTEEWLTLMADDVAADVTGFDTDAIAADILDDLTVHP
jgi:hypothetical protein